MGLSGNNLFVASGGGNTVGVYNSTTGSTINSSRLQPGVVNGPYGIAITANTLFVVSYNANVVGKFDATTGATISANFVPSTGPNNPHPVDLALFGNSLFVSNFIGNTVGQFDATTGAVINAGFITGLENPWCLAVLGNYLFATNGSTVGKYDATTGAVINASFISSGLLYPRDLLVSGNSLFVADSGNNRVGEYDANTGAAINANFITGLSNPQFLAAVPELSAVRLLLGSGTMLLLRRRRAVAL